MEEIHPSATRGIRLDAEGRIAQFGAEAEALFGCRARQALGRPLAEIATESLLGAREQVENAVQELDGLAYAVSHDLRAPLRHLDGFTRLLKEELGDSLGAEARHFLALISESSRRMDRLIDGLLSLSRVGSVPLQRAPIDMHALVTEVVKETKRDAPSRAVQWDIGSLPGSVGDQALLRELWRNLVDNALKFTGQRTRAEIVIGAGAGPVYFIRDNGVGFDAEQAQALFGPFRRLHPAREFEGIGMGLALVRRIAARHGGKVWAEGRAGAGATFYFSLPG